MKLLVGVLAIALAVVAWLVVIWLGDYLWQLAASVGLSLLVMGVLLGWDWMDE